jgi:hypothetical protein
MNLAQFTSTLLFEPLKPLRLQAGKIHRGKFPVCQHLTIAVVINMTEIPMPGDYGYQQPPPPKEKGCCTRCCECWMWILLGVILLFVLLIVLAFMLPGFALFGLFP